MNSIIAVRKLSRDLFPEMEASATKFEVNGGDYELHWMLVWGYALLRWCRWVSQAIQIWGQKWCFRGVWIAKLEPVLEFRNSFGRIFDEFLIGILERCFCVLLGLNWMLNVYIINY